MCTYAHLRTFPRFAVTLVVFFFLGPISIPAEDDEHLDEFITQSRNNRQQLARAARKAVRELGIDRRQAKQLVPIMEKAASLQIETFPLQVKSLPNMLEAFSDFAQEDSTNLGFTPEVEHRTAQSNHHFHIVHEELTRELLTLEEQVAQILSDSQRKLARYNRPGHKRNNRNNQSSKDGSLENVRRELQDLNRKVHPRLSKLGQYLLHPAAGDEICQIADSRTSDSIQQAQYMLENGTEEFPISEIDQLHAQIRCLREEINNWNLINGLHFDQKQIEQILARYDEVAPQPLFAAGQGKNKGKTRISRQTRVSLEKSIEGVLNLGQLQVLADYQACLLPPKNLKNPVRAGQANDHSAYENWLNRARKTSKKELPKMVDRTLLQEEERHGKLKIGEYKNRRQLLLKTGRRIKKMSDADFELGKAELAEKIAPPDLKKALKAEIDSLSRERGLPSLIAQHMIKPSFMDQLRIRNRQLAKGSPTEQADLTKGPQAPNSDKSGAVGTIKNPKNRKKPN